MESELIKDHHITASSTASSWYGGPWKASLARLNRQGTINAWQAQVLILILTCQIYSEQTESNTLSLSVFSLLQFNDMNQWLQVELPKVTKITGIITQGAKALRKEMYVMSYSLQYSNNGIQWNHYTDDESVTFKVSCSKITQTS